MKHTNSLAVLVVAFATSTTLICFGQKKAHFSVGNKKVNIISFNKQMNEMINDIGVPAMGIAVIDNNQVVFSEVYGYKQLEGNKKADHETIFEACSLSKSFLVYLVHQLIDEKKIDPDKPLYQYLPNKRMEHDDRYRKITARMILSHTSGLENWYFENNSDVLEILAPPGEKFVYSGEGFNYLASVIEVILGQSFNEYMDERVLKPLNLKRSFPSFRIEHPSGKTLPENYAVGYDVFDNELEKYINFEPVPSSYFHTTAADYAKIITAIFDRKHLSQARIDEITEPLIIETEKDSTLYAGLGFGVNYCNGDTVTSQWGVNGGFRAQVLYSKRNRYGFVYFTNSDRGWRVTKRLNELLMGFDCTLFNGYSDFGSYYPSQATDLMKIRREQGSDALLTAVDKLQNSKLLQENTLNELASEYSGGYNDLSIALLNRNIEWFPASPNSHALLGEILVTLGDYERASKHLSTAKEMKFKLWNVDASLSACNDHFERCSYYRSFFFNIKDSLLEAENYGWMYGVKLENTSDGGTGKSIGWTDKGDWLDYQINVPDEGFYQVEFRLASDSPKGQLELMTPGSEVLCSVQVPDTDGWQSWTTVTAPVNLKSGNQIIRLNVANGPFNINWIKFTYQNRKP